MIDEAWERARKEVHKRQAALYGKSVGYDAAFREGYSAKYEEWAHQSNPYADGTPEHDGFLDGLSEACQWA